MILIPGGLNPEKSMRTADNNRRDLNLSMVETFI